MALVYLAAAWAAGIWLAHGAWQAGWATCAGPPRPLVAACLAVPLAGLALGRRRPRRRWPALVLAALLLGGLRYLLHPFEPCPTARELAFYNGQPSQPVWATVIGTVVRPPERLVASTRAAEPFGAWISS